MMTISVLDADCYESNNGCYAVYGYEYKPGYVEDKAVCALSLTPEVAKLSADPIISA